MLYGSVGRVGLRALSGTLFSPLSLFADGEQGGWYDPSDLTTLYQDAAGTTPVTAVEQPVGLVLDKSKGLVLSSTEIVTNGGFDTNTAWTVSGGSLGSISISSGVLTVTRSGGYTSAGQSISFTSGKTYRISARARRTSGTGVVGFVVRTTNDNGGTVRLQAQHTPTSSFAEYVAYYVCANTETAFLQLAVSSADGVIEYDDVSLKELPGSHLTQSTSASRPVLSARVNLLTYSEQFNNAAWTNSTVTVTANNVLAPNGTLTADKLEATAADSYLRQGISVTSGVNYTLSVYLRADAPTTVSIYCLSPITPQVCNVTTQWQQFSLNVAPNITGTVNWQIGGGSSFSTGEIVYAWGADLRPTNSGVGLPVYQRVGAATDYTTTGFPLYLKFDGTDDFLQSSTITPGSVDKAQVFVGVRKLSDAVAGVIAELSPTSQTGTFFITEDDTSYTFRSRGISSANATSSIFNAPSTDVLTAIGDISGDRATLRVNGTQVAQSTADQGTSNYLSYPLFIGSRNGTSIRFNGHLYSLILRFSAANLNAATISDTETWVNGKTGAY